VPTLAGSITGPQEMLEGETLKVMTPFRDCTVFTTVNGTGRGAVLVSDYPPHCHIIPASAHAVMIKRYGPIGALDRTRRETA
jgi:hypothetical protein